MRIVYLVGLLVVACTPDQAPRTGGDQALDAPAASSPQRTLNMSLRAEVTDLTPKIPGNSNPSLTKRIFNAAVAIIDAKGTARLRPNLTWHDGQPLTSSDFIFAYRVYTIPGLGMFAPTPQNLMEGVEALDEQTFVIRWSAPYADAAELIDGDFEPLPRHILERPFLALEQDPSAREAFMQLPFWSLEYVGAG